MDYIQAYFYFSGSLYLTILLIEEIKKKISKATTNMVGEAINSSFNGDSNDNPDSMMMFREIADVFTNVVSSSNISNRKHID